MSKRIVLFMFLILWSTSGAFAQLSMSVEQQSVKQILRMIERQSEYRFFYEEGLNGLEKRTSLNVTNAPINEILKAILSGTELIFKEGDNNVIVISHRNDKTQQSTHKITGKVIDYRDGQPIIGAKVSIKGGASQTITDLDGHFSLQVSERDVLEVKYMGYQSSSIVVGKKKKIDIRLHEDNKMLDEVVVVGYGSMKKSDLTGAVSSIKTADLPIASNTSIATMLSGKAAGVSTRQLSAQPGGGVEILIRGAASTGAGNEPLYIIDGFPISGTSVEPSADNRYSDFGSRNPLNSINPNDIESIEILKDASSSAIYGARAANGVVIITTKRGKEGKAVVSYNGSFGIQQISNRIEMMDATQYMNEANKFSYEKWLLDNRVAPYGTTDPNSVVKKWSPVYQQPDIDNAGRGTDWYSLITQNGMINQHNVSVTGGTDKLRYMSSFNFFDQKGVVKNSNFNRFTGRTNIEHQINSIFSYGINATMSYINNTNIPLGNEDFENSGLINSALAYDPTIPVKDNKGDYVISPYMTTVPNPVSMLDITDYTKTRRFLLSAFIQAELTKGLIAKVNMGIDDEQAMRNSYIPTTTLYGKQEGGKASKNLAQRFARLIETTLTYDKIFNDKHKINALLGYSYQDFTHEGLMAANNQFFTNAFLYNSLITGEAKRPTVSSNKSEDKLMSFFGRLNYNLMDKYLFTFTLRSDGSSNFGANNRFGYFPSGAIAWRMKQEDWLLPVDWLSDLKLRLSVGQTGNSNIGNSAFEYYTSAWKQYVFGDAISTGTAKYQIANPDLRWETTTETNFGIDFGFFNQRLSGSFEFFYKQVKDLLGYRTLKSFMEVNTVAANIGKTQSKGLEITLRSNNFTGRFKWNTELNFTRYVDRWLERNPELVLNPWQKNDDPIRAYHSYVADGILSIGETAPAHMPNLLPGQYKVKDVNGYTRDEFGNLLPGEDGKVQYMGRPDGILDEADIILIGTTDPGFSIGMGNTFEYAGFDLNIFFYGMFDRLVNNETRGKYSVPEIRRILQGQNFMTEVMDRWSSTNPNSYLPSGFVTDYPQPSSYLWEEGWFVRCKNITLGYTIPQKWGGKVLSKARLFAEVGNPFVITAYSGNDPETDFKAGYPNQRSFLVGIDITF